MMLELDAQDPGAIGDAVKVLRQVANDEKQEGETRVEAAVALLDLPLTSDRALPRGLCGV